MSTSDSPPISSEIAFALILVVLDHQERLVRPLHETLDLREGVVERLLRHRLLDLCVGAEPQAARRLLIAAR